LRPIGANISLGLSEPLFERHMFVDTWQISCIVFGLEDCRFDMVSQAEALWESKSQIAGLACQDTRHKGPVHQAARLN
jgi:hypothetical protein